ncbi:MAG: FliM/FliN family flagellar motor switch protein [Planctomycetota bacterium]|nr:FliM/FliN family flagellar motor switch protein [Planctomycetota bacterium]
MRHPTDPNSLSRALRLEVPVIVLLGERLLRTNEVLALVPGSIIELAKDAESDLDLQVNNRKVGRGRAVKVGENFGLRITEIGHPVERIDAAVSG